MPRGNLDELLSLIGNASEILSSSEEGAEIFKELSEGKITPDEAVRRFIELAEKKGLVSGLQEVSRELTSLVPGTTSDRPLVFQTSSGLPKLNPLYEAAIAERASLDGDIPELRHGPLPEGTHPAVPVKTDSLDPVVVGLQLRKASRKVQRALLEERQLRLLAAQQQGAKNLPEKIAEVNPTGVSGYWAGEVPDLMEIELPKTKEILALGGSERRFLSYRALSTTQGRLSLSHPIKEEILKGLSKEGVKVSAGSPSPATSVSVAWSMTILGPEDISDDFAYPKMAAAAMTRDLLKKHGEEPLFKHAGGRQLLLEVFPYNGIADRRFGWVARLGLMGEDHE